MGLVQGFQSGDCETDCDEKAELLVGIQCFREVILKETSESGVNIVRVGNQHLDSCDSSFPYYSSAAVTRIEGTDVFQQPLWCYPPPFLEIDFFPPSMALEMCHAGGMAPDRSHAALMVLHPPAQVALVQGVHCLFEATYRDDRPRGLSLLHLQPVVFLRMAHLQPMAVPLNHLRPVVFLRMAHLQPMAVPLNHLRPVVFLRMAHLQPMAVPLNHLRPVVFLRMAHLQPMADPLNHLRPVVFLRMAHLQPMAVPLNHLRPVVFLRMAHLQPMAVPLNHLRPVVFLRMAHLQPMAVPVHIIVNQQLQGRHVMPLGGDDVGVNPPEPDINLDVHIVLHQQQQGRHVMPLNDFDVEIIPPRRVLLHLVGWFKHRTSALHTLSTVMVWFV